MLLKGAPLRLVSLSIETLPHQMYTGTLGSSLDLVLQILNLLLRNGTTNRKCDTQPTQCNCSLNKDIVRIILSLCLQRYKDMDFIYAFYTNSVTVLSLYLMTTVFFLQMALITESTAITVLKLFYFLSCHSSAKELVSWDFVAQWCVQAQQR